MCSAPAAGCRDCCHDFDVMELRPLCVQIMECNGLCQTKVLNVSKRQAGSVHILKHSVCCNFGPWLDRSAERDIRKHFTFHSLTHARTHTHTHERKHARTHSFATSISQGCFQADAEAHKKCSHARTRARTHACTHTHLHTCINSRARSHPRTHVSVFRFSLPPPYPSLSLPQNHSLPYPCAHTHTG